MNNNEQSNLLMDALTGFASDEATSAADAIMFSGEIIQTLSDYIDPGDLLELGRCSPSPMAKCEEALNGDVDPSYGNHDEGKMPSIKPFGDSDTNVKPLGAPTTSAIVSKIDTKTKAKTMNILLHSFWKMIKNNDQSEMGLSKDKIIVAHTALVEKMQAKNWIHTHIDSLDETLPAHLRETIVGPSNPSKGKPDDTEREQITVATTEDDTSTFSTMHVALPEVIINENSCFKLKQEEVDKFLGDKAKDITDNLPDDALYLLVDAVETGTFNKVEITKEELDNAAPGYIGRMFVEGHDWNNPQKAIGQILKADVVFSPQKGKWVMKVLAVVLRKDAIENFERGLYKFVSIGATMKAICTVCGLTVQDGCRHVKGMMYELANGTKVECNYKAADLQMEELSAVNVPACRSASAYGKISRTQARELLAASLESSSGEELVALEAAVELQEIIYGDMQAVGGNMANWQKEFRISDAQGYNCLLQSAGQEVIFGKAYGDLLGHRVVSKEVETLLFAHELLHRWFNQPSRAPGWTEDSIVEKHDEIVAELLEMSVETSEISVMDSILHAKAASLKDGGAAAASPAAVPSASASGSDVALKFPPFEEDEEEAGKPKKDGSGKGQRENKGRGGCSEKEQKEFSKENNKCEICGENLDECKCSRNKEEIIANNSENKLKNNQETLSTDKLFINNNVDDTEMSEDDEEEEQEMKEKDEEPETRHEAISLTGDAIAQRAGYQDGVAQAQAGKTKAKGKDQNCGADLPVKGADYRKGYEAGYKEANKNAEVDHVDHQISKGGIEMAVENTEEKVVLEKAQKDEAKKSGAVKDYGTRKAQGIAKPEVKYSDKDTSMGRKEEKGETNSTHDYDVKDGKAKAEVQYKDPKQDGDNYGYLKCPKCNTGNIMQESSKCPNCGAPHSELIPIKEEERMGDFPYMKTHTAYDAPPMEAKTPGVPTPAAQKSKLSMDDNDTLTGIQSEMKLLKEHISKISSQAENEKNSWYSERRELVSANQSLSDALTANKDNVATLQLDLDTKTSMYKTLLEEHQNVLKQIDEHAKFQKQQLVDEIILSKVKLGLLDDETSNTQMQYYMEKPVETLRVLHEEVTANSERMADIVLQSKFGVPKADMLEEAEADTTEGVKVSKGDAVESKDEAKKLQKKADKLAEDDALAVDEDLGALKQGVEKSTNTIMANVRRSLSNDRRMK